MNLRKLNDVHAGEQNEDGSYVIIYPELTVCDKCVSEPGWGFTEYAEAVAGDSCELCK